MTITNSNNGMTSIDCPFDYLTSEPKNLTVDSNYYYTKVRKYMFNKDEAWEAYNT